MIKGVVILATVLICIFGIIGFPRSVVQLESNVTSRIHLGLDLKERQPSGAPGTGARTPPRLKQIRPSSLSRSTARTGNIAIEGFDRNDPATLQDTDSIQINLHGVEQTKTQEFRSLIADKYPDWILTPVNATDYKMNLKPSALIDLKRNTVTQEAGHNRKARQRSRSHRADHPGAGRARETG